MLSFCNSILVGMSLNRINRYFTFKKKVKKGNKHFIITALSFFYWYNNNETIFCMNRKISKLYFK